jgi:hypothetical protein
LWVWNRLLLPVHEDTLLDIEAADPGLSRWIEIF